MIMKTILNIFIIIIILIITIHPKIISAQKNQAYLEAPNLIQNPDHYYKYSSDSRKFSGISSMAVSESGRMWAVWYAGVTPGEDHNNYVVVATSGDRGTTWKEVFVIDPVHEKVRAYDPEVWIDPDGQLWIFWAQATYIGGTWSLVTEGTSAGVWALTTKKPDSSEPEWSAPRRLTDGVMMCKPTVLSSGEWVLPASIWKLTEESAQMVVSNDRGNTWKVKGGATVPEEVRSYDEHMIVERKDSSLWMLVRTNYGIGQSISTDQGRTWSEVTPSNIEHPTARFFIRRLNSGNLLLVKHGPISIRTNRSHLMAFISMDDGESWSEGLLLDERPGVSYPDGQQTKDGTIYITYDYNRTDDQNILMTSFTEDDILSERYSEKIIEVFNNRRVISDGGRE